jgi:hypothetical protein
MRRSAETAERQAEWGIERRCADRDLLADPPSTP